MTRVSFSSIWDETRVFVGHELPLLAPVALTCFALPMLMISLVMPEPTSLSEPLPQGPWMLWLPLVALFAIFGSMALVALALVPAISVGEALRRAAARLPVALAVLILVTFLITAAIFGALLVSSIVAMVGGLGTRGTYSVVVVLSLATMLVATVRLAVIWPAIIDSHDGPVAALRRAVSLTRGEFWRLLGLLLLAVAVTLVLSMTVQWAGGSVLLLLGQLVGSQPLGMGLAKAFNATIAALWQMLTVIYVAFLYRAYRRAKEG